MQYDSEKKLVPIRMRTWLLDELRIAVDLTKSSLSALVKNVLFGFEMATRNVSGIMLRADGIWIVISELAECPHDHDDVDELLDGGSCGFNDAHSASTPPECGSAPTKLPVVRLRLI